MIALLLFSEWVMDIRGIEHLLDNQLNLLPQKNLSHNSPLPSDT
jgi:hypothetical protein